MEQHAIDDLTLEIRTQIRDALGVSLLEEMGGFESFIFKTERDGKRLIVRATHESHRSQEQLEGELEWVRFLQSRGAAVCGVEPVQDKDFTIAIGPFIISVLEEVEGRMVTEADWKPDLFESWGKHIGLFHRLSSEFKPSTPARRRFQWREDENLNFTARIPTSQKAVLDICGETLSLINKLPLSEEIYGLIHGDAHIGNFLLHRHELTFFDFDDCCYQWFTYDIASILVTVALQPWVKINRGNQIGEVRKFLPAFMKGYVQEFPAPDFIKEHLPLFLKLRELSLYAVIHKHMDVDNITEWFPEKFMHDRREKIEARQPYLENSYMDGW